jgi:hypothetical protein
MLYGGYDGKFLDAVLAKSSKSVKNLSYPTVNGSNFLKSKRDGIKDVVMLISPCV